MNIAMGLEATNVNESHVWSLSDLRRQKCGHEGGFSTIKTSTSVSRAVRLSNQAQHNEHPSVAFYTT